MTDKVEPIRPFQIGFNGRQRMNVGMLWLDDDRQRPFEEKVRRAAEYYHDKYGQAPELCLVHNSMIPAETSVDMIQVQPVRTVLPHHFWLGVRTAVS